MTIGDQVYYTDTQGVKHLIKEYGRQTVVHHLGGSSPSFNTEGVLIDGKEWAGYHDMGIGNPLEQAKLWIEEQYKKRAPSQP